VIEIREPATSDLPALAAIMDAEQLGGESRNRACWVVMEPRVGRFRRVIGGVIANFRYGDYGAAVPSGHGRNHAFVHGIAVAPEYRRRGAGRALMRRVAEGAHAAGLSFLVLMPQERTADDTGHITFFRACGLTSLPSRSPLAPYGAPVADILKRI
jgi:ribosomal protein S18 acetylase RimI-like enzyme